MAVSAIARVSALGRGLQKEGLCWIFITFYLLENNSIFFSSFLSFFSVILPFPLPILFSPSRQISVLLSFSLSPSLSMSVSLSLSVSPFLRPLSSLIQGQFHAPRRGEKVKVDMGTKVEEK